MSENDKPSEDDDARSSVEEETTPDDDAKPSVEEQATSDNDARPPARQMLLIRSLSFHWEYALFIVLNLGALFLILLAAEQHPGASGPARWMPEPLGMTGYVVLRILVMLGVVWLCEMLARQRKPLARLLIWFGIVLLLAETTLAGMQYYAVLRSQAGAV